MVYAISSLHALFHITMLFCDCDHSGSFRSATVLHLSVARVCHVGKENLVSFSASSFLRLAVFIVASTTWAEDSASVNQADRGSFVGFHRRMILARSRYNVTMQRLALLITSLRLS